MNHGTKAVGNAWVAVEAAGEREAEKAMDKAARREMLSRGKPTHAKRLAEYEAAKVAWRKIAHPYRNG